MPPPPQEPAILPGLDSSDVVTDYLDQTGAVTASFNDIRYVRVSIVGFTHTLLIPALLPGLPAMTLTAPAFETTLPRESLGSCAGWRRQYAMSVNDNQEGSLISDQIRFATLTTVNL